MILLTSGACLFVLYMLMSLFIQARLFGKGLLKSRWLTVISMIRMYRTYIREARQSHWSPSIGYLAPICLISSLVLIFWGVVATGPHR
jgi:hypothetical protein